MKDSRLWCLVGPRLNVADEVGDEGSSQSMRMESFCQPHSAKRVPPTVSSARVFSGVREGEGQDFCLMTTSLVNCCLETAAKDVLDHMLCVESQIY